MLDYYMYYFTWNIYNYCFLKSDSILHIPILISMSSIISQVHQSGQEIKLYKSSLPSGQVNIKNIKMTLFSPVTYIEGIPEIYNALRIHSVYVQESYKFFNRHLFGPWMDLHLCKKFIQEDEMRMENVTCKKLV